MQLKSPLFFCTSSIGAKLMCRELWIGLRNDVRGSFFAKVHHKCPSASFQFVNELHVRASTETTSDNEKPCDLSRLILRSDASESNQILAYKTPCLLEVRS
jgi:hypothetical protein